MGVLIGLNKKVLAIILDKNIILIVIRPIKTRSLMKLLEKWLILESLRFLWSEVLGRVNKVFTS